MKKFELFFSYLYRKNRKLVRTMKLILILLTACFLQVSASVYSQVTKFTFDVKNQRIEEVLRQIEDQSKFRFFYQREQIDVEKKVTFKATDETLEQVLGYLFEGQEIIYHIRHDNLVLIKDRNEPYQNENFWNLQQQPRVVTGKVTNQQEEPLPGVSIVVKGTTQGTVTNADGEYSITGVSGDATLSFSFIGMQTQEINVGNQTNINVTMEEDIIGIDEVVAIGYGTQRKVNLSGSVVAVQGNEIAQRSLIQTSQALQGMVPGVTVTSSSGKPGEENTSIRIRGIGTVNDNNPLVLVDGVASSMDAVDPSDVESISILKDAASSSIYGSRAANGVILITTKRGKTRDLVVNYKGQTGFTEFIETPDNANAWDFMMLYDEALSNDLRNDEGEPGGYMYGPELINTWKNATDRDKYPNSDIFNETYMDQAAQTYHYLSFAVGNEKLSSNTSINYTWQDAHYANSDLVRYGVRSNNSYAFSKHLEIGVDLSFMNTDRQDAITGEHRLDQLMRHPAIYQTRYSNGVWGGNYSQDPHAMHYINEGLAMTYEDGNTTIAKITASVTPFEGMKIDFWYSPKILRTDYKIFNKETYLYDYETMEVIREWELPNNIDERRSRTREDDLNALMNYNNSFGEHNITVLGGFQWLTNNYNYLRVYRQNNPFQQFQEVDAYDPTNQSTSGYSTEWALMSFFGRLNYDFAGKYLLEGNIRYDGSSRFANNYKWGVFPSFSGAWRFSEEPFMKGIGWLDNAKFRASWGELGNQSGLGSNYPFALTVATNQYTVFGNELNPGYAPVNYAMRDITWESTRMIDFGIDFTILRGQLDVTFDWYKKDTRDILLNIAIPGIMGYANSPKQNAGSVENKGWDLSITHNNYIGDFYYRVRGVLSDVRNKITEFGGLPPQVSGVHVRQVGDPIDALYGYLDDGYFSSFEEARSHPVAQWGKLQGGDIRYLDLDDDDKMTGDDRVVLGNPIPRYTYSLDLYGKYKNFDLTIFFQGVGKRDGYLGGWLAYPFANASTALVQHLDRWYEGNPDPNATYPRLSINQHSNNTQPSSFWMISAAYLRLKNIQLGYSLPDRLFKNKGISDVRFFANGNNVFTIENMPLGMDPESPESVQNSYPLIKTYTFGVEVKF
jgi:TonB-linked SusC/RagA family outer membrane protein